ncbi:hypothetical protein LTR94_025061, partial [Friedmanniomyces endolithicus]
MELMMRIFVTGATGFVGSAVVRELIAHGHLVLGLTRSKKGAEALKAMGAEPHAGDLEALQTLVEGVKEADAVIHTGFVHDFSQFDRSCEIDRQAIDAMGQAMEGEAKPFIVTSGVAAIDAAGPQALEIDAARPASPTYPRLSETAARTLTARGIPVSLMRLPPSVHGRGDHGFVPILIDLARRTGRSAFVGEGSNLWPAVHVGDAARAYRLAIEKGAGAGVMAADTLAGMGGERTVRFLSPLPFFTGEGW